MDKIIKDGSLRLMITESSCDVILSCSDHRLMAHKLMLSIASPVLRDLLDKHSSDSTLVLILPDVTSATMSAILEYIYTGTVLLYAHSLNEFLSATQSLQIAVDTQVIEDIINIKKWDSKEFYVDNYKEDTQSNKTDSSDDNQRQSNLESTNHSSWSQSVYKEKKLPALLPIDSLRNVASKVSKVVVPSPWRQREKSFLGDPRIVPPGPDLKITKLCVEDNNNNLQQTYNNPAIVQNLHLYSSLAKKSNLKSLEVSNKLELPRQELTFTKHLTGLQPFDKRYLDQHQSNNCDSRNLSSSETTPSTSKLRHSKQVVVDSASESSDDSKTEKPSEHTVSGSSDEDKQRTKSKKNFKCDECGKCFKQLRNYKYHRSIHEGTKEFSAKCPECGKTFNDRGYLSSHMKIHRDRKEYACPHCPKRFNQRVAYNMHLRIHTGVKPHVCPTCGKSFSRKMLLKQHQRVHTGERPYSCPECGKSFADRSNMSLHARLHTGVKPYTCTVCPKSFTKKHHLKTHMNFHTGLKPYSCENCGLAFSQSSNMRTHYKKCILKEQTGSKKDNSTLN